MDMKTTIAHLRLPSPWTGRPADIAARYGDRPFEFDTADRAASSEEHRLLFEAVAEAKKAGRCGWFRCACRDDIELAVMVRARQPLPYLALMPGTSLQHHPLCAFHRAPITSHVSDAITEEADGSLRVRLNFRLGIPAPDKEPGTTIINETPLRTRQAPTRQLNKFGLDGLLRLLFSESGMHRWPRTDQTATAAAAGSWKPMYARLLQTLGWIDAQGQRSGSLKAYTRIGTPGTVAAFEPGTLLAIIDVVEKIEAPKNGYNWKCYLAGWGENFLIISPAQVRALLAQLRFHPTRAGATLTEKWPVLPRPTEVWWGCLLVRVEQGTSGKRYRVMDHATLRTDRHGIPAESLGEIEMTQYLVEQGRAFCKPLFPGELVAVPWRRPDFIMEDTAQPCCIEVAGLDGVYDYSDRDDERLADYDEAQVNYQRWKPGDPPLVLDGPFRRR
jgi:hypothetical protein